MSDTPIIRGIRFTFRAPTEGDQGSLGLSVDWDPKPDTPPGSWDGLDLLRPKRAGIYNGLFSTKPEINIRHYRVLLLAAIRSKLQVPEPVSGTDLDALPDWGKGDANNRLQNLRDNLKDTVWDLILERDEGKGLFSIHSSVNVKDVVLPDNLEAAREWLQIGVDGFALQRDGATKSNSVAGTDASVVDNDTAGVNIKYPPPQGRQQETLGSLGNATLLARQCESEGLVEVQRRGEAEPMLSPWSIIDRADKELVIAACSAHDLLYDHPKALLKALDEREVNVYMMILNRTAATTLDQIREVEMHDPADDMVKISKILRKHFVSQERFKIRFLSAMPPFLAIMIDGNLEAEDGKVLSTGRGEIRVQPASPYITPSEGIVFHFTEAATHGGTGGFEYYARDLRRRWRDDAKPDPTAFLIE